MRGLTHSHFASAVVGGAVVAGSLALLGVVADPNRQTIIEQSPLGVQPISSSAMAPTPHAIYVRDAPGVVFVRARVLEQVQGPFDLIPQQESSTSTGSGFLIDTHGHILTDDHVIQGADRRVGVTVQFEDNVSRRAVVVGENQNDDLAVLKVDMAGVPSVEPLALGDSTSVRVGDTTLAIGNPFGFDRTLTSGIVSALQRQIQAPNGFTIDNVIQTDAPINPGNSGGPLLDATGRVIGINSQIATGDAGNSGVGIGFALPVNTAKALLPGLETGSDLRISYLGVDGVSARSSQGIVVEHAPAGGPAASAGLKAGDVIETVAGRASGSMSALQAIVRTRSPGQAVQVQVRRRGHTRVFKVVLGIPPWHAMVP